MVIFNSHVSLSEGNMRWTNKDIGFNPNMAGFYKKMWTCGDSNIIKLQKFFPNNFRKAIVNHPHRIDGLCRPLIVKLRMVCYCFTNMVISPFGSSFCFLFLEVIMWKTRHQKRTWYGIIDFWEGTANAPSQIIAIMAPSRILCHTSFSKLRLDPWVAETTVRIGDPGATRLEWEASGGQVRRAMPGRWELSGFNQWLAVKKCWHLRLGRSFQHVAIWWSSISLWGGSIPGDTTCLAYLNWFRSRWNRSIDVYSMSLCMYVCLYVCISYHIISYHDIST